MNAYLEGVTAALGIDAAVGTPEQLFNPSSYKDVWPNWYFSRKLSTQDIAALMQVDPSTVSAWRKRGWLKGNKTGTRKGWRKLVFWRHSLHDVEDCLLKMRTRKQRGNPVEHKTWTPQEIELLQRGVAPEYRSPTACRVKQCRLRKELKI